METQVGYVTEEEFWARYGETRHRVELVDGEVIPKYGVDGPLSPTSTGHGVIVMNLLVSLTMHVRGRNLGRVFTDPAAFVISEVPKRIRCPDVAFVRADRLPAEFRMGEMLRLAPEFVVEVISPSEPLRSVEKKRTEYLASGVLLLWQVDARDRSVVAYEPDGTSRAYIGNDVLPGGDVVPGYELPVTELFAGVAAARPRRRR